MESKLSALGFLRAAVASPELRVADIDFNTRAILKTLADLSQSGCQLAVFPELCLTGYTCADLFYQALVLEGALEALEEIAAATSEHPIAAVVGLPLEAFGKLYNCAALLSGGEILGLVPKTHLPATNEFYEERWFTPATQVEREQVEIAGREVPFGPDLLFKAQDLPGLTIGIEICEDLWGVEPLSGSMALAGATVLVNPSASTEQLGKSDYRRDLVKGQSARCVGAYLYACAGPGESTTDVVYPGHSLIAENGVVLAETSKFQFSTQVGLADIDLGLLTHERVKNSSFSASQPSREYRMIGFAGPTPSRSSTIDRLLRPISTTPFVPADPSQRAETCREVIAIQSTGLAKRLKHTGVERVTLGISGGLDSTLALLVTVKSFEILGLDKQGILGLTMPGPGTTSRTLANAEKLVELLGGTLRRIPIGKAVERHFQDIGQDPGTFDTTYQNAQARERTQILMDLGNKEGGFTVGTGDLSELALGWCTFNGDHMSMYHVNAGVPKTLVRYLIQWSAESEYQGEASRILTDICQTPITPELLPLDANGDLEQKTEETIGPFELHDFFLYYTVRYAFPPRKIHALACQAFQEQYTPGTILRWMKVFYQRFISQQFKRSAMPDGPKVGSVALSPRGDWRMPSDASPALWQKELEKLEKELES